MAARVRVVFAAAPFARVEERVDGGWKPLVDPWDRVPVDDVTWDATIRCARGAPRESDELYDWSLSLRLPTEPTTDRPLRIVAPPRGNFAGFVADIP